MELGRTPNIAPATVSNTSSDSGTQATQTTQLPAFQTVTPIARSESATLNFREVPLNSERAADAAEETSAEATESRQERREREIRREIEIDRDTSVLIFRAIDASTGDVVQQYPEEARLNLRAYLEQNAAEQIERDAS